MLFLNKILILLAIIASILISDCVSNKHQHNHDHLKPYEAKPTPTKHDFIEWMKAHNKEYDDLEEFEQRFETFIENHFSVEKLNQIYFGHTEFKLNKWADWKASDFKSKILIENLNKPFVSPKEKYLHESDIDEVPNSFDWRDLGAVTPIKDQGQVGTCWAFSAAENLEGIYAVKTKKLVNISVEQIVDCDGGHGEHSDCGVYGGWPYLAFEYVKNAGGICLEADYSYCSGSGKCLPCGAPGYNKTECGPPVPFCRLSDSCQAKLNTKKFISDLKVSDWKRISENETDIALQMMTNGPLSVALNAELLQFYFKGVFDPFDRICNRENLNHAVLMVGWGVENSRIFGKVPYWIVKNSWGKKWGENGYFRIIRGKGKCGINSQVTTAILD